MIQARGQLNLSKKALAAERFGEIGMQHFDRDFPIVLEVVGQVDGGHPARAELAVEAIAIGERFDQERRASTRRGYIEQAGAAKLSRRVGSTYLCPPESQLPANSAYLDL